MSPTLIVILGLALPALSYFATAYGYLGLKRPWMMGAFIFYALANFCFIMDAVDKPDDA